MVRAARKLADRVGFDMETGLHLSDAPAQQEAPDNLDDCKLGLKKKKIYHKKHSYFEKNHHHLPVAYAVGVPADLHKLLHSWRSWAEEKRECTSILVHSLMLDNQDFLGLPLFLPPSTVR